MKKVITVPKGILHSKEGSKKFTLHRYKPSIEASAIVQHYWFVRWDLLEDTPYEQHVVSHPNINLVFEKDYASIHGIKRTISSHLLEGRGSVFGVKFLPGGFYPLWKKDISQLTEKSIDFQEVFHIDSKTIRDQLFQNHDVAELSIPLIDQLICPNLPEPDEKVDLISQIVLFIREDRSIIKVEDVANKFNLHVRTLQRLFDRYVGVSPKWVIKRYRLHEVVESIDKGSTKNWADLYTRLGYYDQAHFIKDFRLIVGKSPEKYFKES
ncbi:DUF6597 domain-containing transcriptional factor [Gracilibacillus dipsosauri]|uniref:DUF6597 domain-containing transcriptional factor n=1 Tax=Gracilibacillus dipsosauri TaxID=178340 RepID=UPI00240A4940